MIRFGRVQIREALKLPLSHEVLRKQAREWHEMSRGTRAASYHILAQAAEDIGEGLHQEADRLELVEQNRRIVASLQG